MSRSAVVPSGPDGVKLPPLPSHWQWAKLEHLLVRIEAGRSFRCDERPPTTDEYGVVKVSAVTWGAYDEEESKTITDSERIEEAYLIRAGDFLFSRANTIQLVGASVIVHATSKRLLLSDKILRFVFVADIRKWINWLFKSHVGRSQIEALATGNQESMRNIGQQRIGQICVPVAPPKEMDRIVSKIDELFSRIEEGEHALERVQKLVERYRQSVLKAAVTGELTRDWREKNKGEHESGEALLARILKARREAWEKAELDKMKAKGVKPVNDKWKQRYDEASPPDTTDLPELPETWVWASLDQLCGLITSGSRGWSEHYAESGAIFIRAQNIKRDVLDLDDVAFVDLVGVTEGTRTKVDLDDLLVTITGANVTKAARVSAVLENAFVSQHVALVRPVLCDTSSFLFNWVVSPANGRATLLASAYGAGKPGLSLEDLKELAVALPPQAEQDAICDLVAIETTRIDSIASDAGARARTVLQLRQAILAAAFSGTLVRQESSDEPASLLLDRIATERGKVPARSRGGFKKKTQELT